MHYLAKRTAQAIITVFSVITLSFVLIRLLPGGPMDFLRAMIIDDMMSGQNVDYERLNNLMELYTNLNPSEPVWVQYLNYMHAVLIEGDLGYSIIHSEPVAEVLGPAIPWTVFIMSLGVLITYGIAIPLGSLIAYREGSYLDSTVSLVSILGPSVPYYVIAVLSILFLGFELNLFPHAGNVSGNYSPGFTPQFIGDVLWHAALPIFSLSLFGWGGKTLAMRGNSIQVLGEDYMRVAKIRGLRTPRMASRYVMRNAILPLYTGFVISIAGVFGGSIILETIFTYPGVGYYLVRAFNARDWPLMMGGFILLTTSVVIAIFIADLTYGKLDPRTKKTGGM